MGRSPCCEKVGLKKGPWTHEEDEKLLAYIEEHGHRCWRALPAKAGLRRCGKSCRLRWTNYLRPDIKRGKFTLQEEQTIIQLHALLGNRWSAIAAHLPKRTDNEIKNYWNTHLKKRLTKMGIDPITHKPKSDALGGSGQSKDAANLSHMAQWESARLEAEARLVRAGSKLVTNNPYQPQLGSSASAQLLNKATAHPTPLLAPNMPPCLDVLTAWQGTWTNPTKDVHGISLNNSIFSSNGTLESPTSTLNFSENMFNNINPPPSAVGYVENSQLGAMNYTEIPHPIDGTYIADTLRLPIGFMESCTDHLQPENDGYDLTNVTEQSDQNVDGGDFDENKNYWNNLNNLMTLNSGWPVL